MVRDRPRNPPPIPVTGAEPPTHDRRGTGISCDSFAVTIFATMGVEHLLAAAMGGAVITDVCEAPTTTRGRGVVTPTLQAGAITTEARRITGVEARNPAALKTPPATPTPKLPAPPTPPLPRVYFMDNC